MPGSWFDFQLKFGDILQPITTSEWQSMHQTRSASKETVGIGLIRTQTKPRRGLMGRKGDFGLTNSQSRHVGHQSIAPVDTCSRRTRLWPLSQVETQKAVAYGQDLERNDSRQPVYIGASDGSVFGQQREEASRMLNSVGDGTICAVFMAQDRPHKSLEKCSARCRERCSDAMKWLDSSLHGIKEHLNAVSGAETNLEYTECSTSKTRLLRANGRVAGSLQREFFTLNECLDWHKTRRHSCKAYACDSGSRCCCFYQWLAVRDGLAMLIEHAIKLEQGLHREVKIHGSSVHGIEKG